MAEEVTSGGRLPPNLVIGEVDGWCLAGNLARFVRMLRELGFGSGPGKVAECVRALGMVNVGQRMDFYWALHALMVERQEQRPLFAQAFRLFWRNVDPLVDELDLLAPTDGMPGPAPKSPVSRRIDEIWHRHKLVQREAETVEVDSVGTASSSELLADKDFEQMSGEEWRMAKAVARDLVLGLKPKRTRRHMSSRLGAFDVKATVRAALRTGGEPFEVRRRRRKLRPPPVVAICDISGSMSSYSRMFLHFMHGLNDAGTRARRFVFGTRLTCVDRCLRHADPDVALELAGRVVPDWSGGTRITDALCDFNRDWARRTLAQGAVVLLATDGLERGDEEKVQKLEQQIERLAKSCSRLVWLNPLLRHDDYEALARGARAIERHADETMSIHNLSSLAELGLALAGREDGRKRPH